MRREYDNDGTHREKNGFYIDRFGLRRVWMVVGHVEFRMPCRVIKFITSADWTNVTGGDKSRVIDLIAVIYFTYKIWTEHDRIHRISTS